MTLPRTEWGLDGSIWMVPFAALAGISGVLMTKSEPHGGEHTNCVVITTFILLLLFSLGLFYAQGLTIRECPEQNPSHEPGQYAFK